MKSNSNRTIMIVEDDRTHCALMSEIMLKFGFKAILAENGAVALTKIQNGQHIDLVFMDLMMPEMNGLDTARFIRAMQAKKEWSLFPIIAFTASQDTEDREECLSAGMDDYVHKEIWLPKWRNSLMEKLCLWLPESADDIVQRYEVTEAKLKRAGSYGV